MPNHISNRLTILGDPGKVSKVFDAIKGIYADGKERLIDFDKIIPMPEVLKNVGRGSNTIEGQRVSTWWTDNSVDDNDPNKKPDRLLTSHELREIAKTGFSDWYDWGIAKWGTKWNAYDHKRLSDHVIDFETAWAAPTSVLEAIAAKFPEVEITLEYADEDKGRNAGIVKYIGGQVG